MSSDATLRALYEQMCRGRAPWESLPWAEPPPASLPHLLPPALTEAAFPRTWPQLDAADQVHLAHTQLGCDTEVFIYLEHLLIAAAQGVLASLADDAAAALPLAKLVEEEYNHLQQFQRYLRTRLPAAYPPDQPFRYRFKPARRVQALIALVGRIARRAPAAGLLWGEYFELLTIQFHGVLHDRAAEADPLLLGLHHLHAREEARHVALDGIVFARDYDGRTLAGKAARSWGALAVFAAIGEVERAGFATLVDRFLEDRPALAHLRQALQQDCSLGERTVVFERTAARFAPRFRKLEPIVGRRLFERIMLRGPIPGS